LHRYCAATLAELEVAEIDIRRSQDTSVIDALVLVKISILDGDNGLS